MAGTHPYTHSPSSPEHRVEVERRYQGASGRNYAVGRFGDRMRFGREYQARLFMPFCDTGKVILDFGCGDGTILRCLPAARKVGVELSEACHEEIARLNAGEAVPVEVFAHLEDVPQGSADVVVSNHCLEHVPAPLDTLVGIRRVLRQSGLLVLVVPFDDWRSVRHGRWQPGPDPDGHLYTWSPLNLGNILSAAGFAVRSVELRRFAWSPRIFWIYRTCGDRAFRGACRLLAMLRHRTEVMAVASRAATD